MNYGPLQFAAYLKSRGERTDERPDSAAVQAARAAAPVERAEMNRLTIVSGKGSIARGAGTAQGDAVSVYEAVAIHPLGVAPIRGPLSVAVKTRQRPVVLVLSAHQTVRWEVAVAEGAKLSAVLLSGYGESTVDGAGDVPVASIGGFYAFKRGSTEFKHLESEVMRCTGRQIHNFQSVYAGKSFEI
jgi:hypothetical protein